MEERPAKTGERDCSWPHRLSTGEHSSFLMQVQGTDIQGAAGKGRRWDQPGEGAGGGQAGSRAVVGGVQRGRSRTICAWGWLLPPQPPGNPPG